MLNSVKNVEFESSGGILIAHVKGEVDHHNAGVARHAIDRELERERPSQLALDLSAVSFMDSSGLGLILGRYNKASELGVKFTVRNPTPATMKIISLAGGERIFDVITDHIENE
ncbi:MAG: STAS domain-containing protein [Clostridia bacterium]|nr:STAS domain-containing protein [Clostridia bacterium]